MNDGRARGVLFAVTLAGVAGVFAGGAVKLAPWGEALAQGRPMVERVVPSSGAVGSRVQIVGRGFRRTYRVLFNEREVPPVEFLSGRITVVVPPGATTGRWVLSDGSDEVETEVFRVTSAGAEPVVHSIGPLVVSPGDEVTVRGSGFASRPTENGVRVNGVAMTVRRADESSLTVMVPPGAVSGPVFVRVGGAEARAPMELTVRSRVVIRAVRPGAVAPGGRVTVTGAGFSSVVSHNRLSVGGRPLRVLTARADELTAEVPLRAQTGTLSVTVDGEGRYDSTVRLFVGAAPAVREMVPSNGAVGTRVTLRGEHFGSDVARVSVTVSGRAARVLTVAPTELVVTVPEGASTGPMAVTVDGVGPVESPSVFTVSEPLRVTGFDPRSGDAGDRLTVHGRGFSTVLSENEVMLNAVALRVVSATGEALECELPEGARSGNISVRVGLARVVAREPFRVTQRPRITAVEPSQGVAGAEVTLRGERFPAERALVTVRLNGVDVPVVRYARDAVVVRVPERAQTGRFQVIARLQGTGTAPVDFVVLQAMDLRSVEPPAGPVGSTVTLHGAGFEPDASRLTVRLGTRVVRPTSTSTTEVVFRVPRGARDGVISLSAEGRQTVSSRETFRVTVSPVVTTVRPMRAQAGARLVITGRNFGSDPSGVGVFIHGVSCPVASVTPTRVECVVPPGAATGPLMLRVAYAGEATARGVFTVLP